MRKIKIFGVYDGDQLVFEGDKRKIAEKFKLKDSSMNTYASNKAKIRGIYELKMIREEESEIKYKKRIYKNGRKKPEPEKEYSLEKDPVECIVWLLKCYGNAYVTSHDPREYLDEIKKAGFDCRVKEIPECVNKRLTTTRGRKPKQRCSYLVEVI